MNDLREGFSRFFAAGPGRLHAAAHSHHPWPDVTFEAQMQAWEDAAVLADDKWDKVLGEVIPEGQRHIATRLRLSDPDSIAFGPNTHSFLMRILSCLGGHDATPLRILSTDGEFHSFERQARRLEECGRATVLRVAAEPFATFPERFAAAATDGGFDLVYLSHVQFNSGYVVPGLAALVAVVPDDTTLVVIDGYHGFMAVPTDLSDIEHRAFYLAGGYKYAMSGEGVCFLHCPPGYGPRPPDTGWFATFSQLATAPAPGAVPYGPDGSRFLGATFDPTGLYRFNAVQRWLAAVTVEEVHAHVGRLQRRFLDAVGTGAPGRLVPADGEGDAERKADRGHFLAFATPDAGAVASRLATAGVTVDVRADRLRIGFGVYHDEADIDRLAALVLALWA